MRAAATWFGCMRAREGELMYLLSVLKFGKCVCCGERTADTSILDGALAPWGGCVLTGMGISDVK